MADTTESMIKSSINVGDEQGGKLGRLADVAMPVGQAVVSAATSGAKTEENSFYDTYRRVQNVAAVSSLVIGSYSEISSARAYNHMDFQNDAYLNQIGMGTGGQAQQAFDNYANNITFESHSAPQTDNIHVDTNFVNIGAEKITAGDLSSISSTGTMSYGGVTYGASIESNGDVRLTPNSCGGFFATPNDTPATTIQIDPLQGIASVSSTVTPTSLSGAEKASLDATGSFNRGGVTYQGAKTDDGFVNISASVSYNSPAYNNVCAQFNTPFKPTNYEMKASSLNGNQLADIAKNGTYDLGGMKFSIVPNYAKGMETVSAEGFTSRYQALSAKASNEMASHHDSLTAFTKQGKAQTLASIQNAGIRAVQQTGMTNFNGSNWRLCLAKTNHDINALKSKQGSMDPAAFAQQMALLNNRKSLIEGYASHGGRIKHPTKNNRAQGGRLVANFMLGSDMMRGIDFVKNTGKVTALAYRATTGVAANMAYLGSTAANKIVRGSIGKIAGKDNVVYKGLGQAQGKKKELYQNRKDRIRSRKGGRKAKRDYRARRRDARFNKRTDRMSNMIAKARAKGNDKLADRLQKIFNGRNKVHGFKPNMLKKFGDAKTRLLNSKLGKFGSKASKFIKAPFAAVDLVKQILGWLKKMIMKLVIALVLVYLAFVGVTCAVLYFSYMVPKFLSDLSLPSDTYARLNDVNYMQLIVTTTEEDIVQDLQLICEIDATNHFLGKKQIPTTIDNKDGTYKHYPWYMASNFGEINNVWAWEEADNTSRYANEEDELSYEYNEDDPNSKSDPTLQGCTGDLIYANENIPHGENGNTYVSQSERQNINDIEANLVPILSMCHHRYYDNVNFETWPTALGYVYYMYSMSHDIARYDADATYNREQYGDTKPDPGYDYRIEEPHKDALNLYSAPIEWDSESHTLKRSTESCTNIYVHDFDCEGYTNKVTSVTLGHASETTGKLGQGMRWVTQKAHSLWSLFTGDDYQTADTFDKGYTLANDGLTLNLRKLSLKGIKNRTAANNTINYTIEALASKIHMDIKKNLSGIFMYDGSEESLPHSQYDAANYDTETWEEYAEEVFNQTCDNVLYFPYGVTSDDGNSNSDTYDARLIPGEDDGAGAIDGCHDHCWEDGCYKLTCTESESEGHWVNNNTNEESIAEDPNAHFEAGHTHGAGCYDFTQFECAHGKAYQSEGGHAPWISESDHGCWKTVAICGGHCGGHITPLVNIVQKMTYEGLAQDDNFRTPYWLQKEEIVNSAAYAGSGIYALLDTAIGESVVSVGQFRAYWKLKCNSWFSPIPRSPYSFYKTIGKNMIANFCKAWDNFADAFNNLWAGLFGGGGGGDSSSEDDDKFAVTDDEWKEEDATSHDLWGWPGWWHDNNKIDTMLISEVEDFGGSWKRDQYKIGIGNWGEWKVTFGSFGIQQGKIYSEQEIIDIIDQMSSYYYDYSGMELNDQQRAILEAALSRCGTFGYSLTGTAHQNGINNDSGLSDCSGWVSGTLNKALGTNYDLSASMFASKGVYNGKKVPGSVISHNKGGVGSNGNTYTGHVMIYAGYLENGPDNGKSGHYVMDCTKGGSSLRWVSQSTLDRYQYSWNPWE